VDKLAKDEKLISKIRQRFARDFLDMLVLTIIRIRPMWGYKIIGEIERDFGVKVGYGTIYPLLGSLEERGFVRSRLESRNKRKRKVYEITVKGIELIKSYNEFLREQLERSEVIF
jgi:PadR family transcriptional regulator PadR